MVHDQGQEDADLSEARHCFHAGTAGVDNDRKQQGHTHTNADAADPADAHLQGTCIAPGVCHMQCKLPGREELLAT